MTLLLPGSIVKRNMVDRKYLIEVTFPKATDSEKSSRRHPKGSFENKSTEKSALEKSVFPCECSEINVLKIKLCTEI